MIHSISSKDKMISSLHRPGVMRTTSAPTAGAAGGNVRVFGLQEDIWEPPNTRVFIRYNLTQKFTEVSESPPPPTMMNKVSDSGNTHTTLGQRVQSYIFLKLSKAGTNTSYLFRYSLSPHCSLSWVCLGYGLRNLSYLYSSCLLNTLLLLLLLGACRFAQLREHNFSFFQRRIFNCVTRIFIKQFLIEFFCPLRPGWRRRSVP